MNENQSAIHDALCDAVEQHKASAIYLEDLVDRVYADLQADTTLDLSKFVRSRASRRVQRYLHECQLIDAEDRGDLAEIARLESLPVLTS